MTVKVEKRELLLKADDTFRMEVLTPDMLTAPVEEGETVGTVIYYVNDRILDLFPVCMEDASPVIDYEWCLELIIRRWMPGGIRS